MDLIRLLFKERYAPGCFEELLSRADEGLAPFLSVSHEVPIFWFLSSNFAGGLPAAGVLLLRLRCLPVGLGVAFRTEGRIPGRRADAGIGAKGFSNGFDPGCGLELPELSEPFFQSSESSSLKKSSM